MVEMRASYSSIHHSHVYLLYSNVSIEGIPGIDSLLSGDVILEESERERERYDHFGNRSYIN